MRKHGFSLYLRTHNFANFYYFSNLKKPPKGATFQLSISLIICMIWTFITKDIANWEKKFQEGLLPLSLLLVFTGWFHFCMLNSMHRCSLKVITSSTHQSPPWGKTEYDNREVNNRPPPPPPPPPPSPAWM